MYLFQERSRMLIYFTGIFVRTLNVKYKTKSNDIPLVDRRRIISNIGYNVNSSNGCCLCTRVIR